MGSPTPRPTRRHVASPLLLALLLTSVFIVVGHEPRPGRANARALEARFVTPGRMSSPALDATRDILPDRFEEYASRRFVVLSDAEPTWARRQLQYLERTHHQFHRFARRLGVTLEPITEPLVCVIFAEREAYRRFATRHDHVRSHWVAGYYAPQTDRTVLYDPEANPSVIQARVRLAELHADAEQLEREAREARAQGAPDHAEALRAHRQRYEEHLRRETDRIDAFAEDVTVATTVHETVHQLMYHTGLQARGVAIPFWFAEGLATAFETESTDHAFGPDHDHPGRREGFEAAASEHGLVPLRIFVGWTDLETANEAEVRAAYHQAYALVTWLARHRKAEFAHFVERSRDAAPGPASAAELRKRFENAFGDVDRLEASWLRAEGLR